MSPVTSAISAASLSRCRALLARPAVALLLDLLGGSLDQARLVGGAVRDAVIGRSVSDIDIATVHLPGEVIARAQKAGIKAVPTGLQHGTVTLVVEGTPYEVTTLRRDLDTDGRHAAVEFTTEFAVDAARRDFTFNALMLGQDGTIHDTATGIGDALAGRVRFMGDPEERIREDYLRILRFFRFHASHGHGAPEQRGLEAAAAHKDGLSRLSRERIRQEMFKLLVAEGALPTVTVMADVGVLAMVLPGQTAKGLARLAHLSAAEAAFALPASPVRRLLALAPDRSVLPQAFRLSNAEAGEIHAAADGVAEFALATLSAHDIRRLVYRHGEKGALAALLFALSEAGSGADAMAEAREHWEQGSKNVPAHSPFSAAPLLAEGHPPGPRLGDILRRAEQQWLAEGLPEDAMAQGRILAAARSAAPS